MMKILLVALNSKFIHTTPSVYLLKENTEGFNISVYESNVNTDINKIYAEIKGFNADLVCFSCYIYNIMSVIILCKMLKSDDVEIVLGGPEVSFLNKAPPYADYVICGEGEEVFKEFLEAYSDGKKLKKIYGAKLVAVLDNLKTIYNKANLKAFSNKIIYYESSRGCPYKCSYCLSSRGCGVRYYGIERVKKDLIFLIENNVKQVKFVDRTFNCDARRSYGIFEFLIKKCADKDINFHFECAGDLFDGRTLNLLKTAPKGLFQFEIGIQSCNEKTLEAIDRKTNIERLFNNLKTLLGFANIHIHADLIAGLPYEGLELFKESFNKAFGLFSDNLQLGFLKLLKGTKIRKEAKKYGYRYKKLPPYEVICNSVLSESDIKIIKKVEKALNVFYNKGKFLNGLKLLYGAEAIIYEPPRACGAALRRGEFAFQLKTDNCQLITFFDLFVSLYDAATRKNQNEIMTALYEFMLERGINKILAKESLKLDYFALRKGFSHPTFMKKGLTVKPLENNRFSVSFEYNFEKNAFEDCVYVFDYNDYDKVKNSYNYKIK